MTRRYLRTIVETTIKSEECEKKEKKQSRKRKNSRALCLRGLAYLWCEQSRAERDRDNRYSRNTRFDDVSLDNYFKSMESVADSKENRKTIRVHHHGKENSDRMTHFVLRAPHSHVARYFSRPSREYCDVGCAADVSASVDSCFDYSGVSVGLTDLSPRFPRPSNGRRFINAIKS